MAKEKQIESGGAVPKKSAKPPIETRQEIAKAAGVSHDTIAKVEKIEAQATPEIKAALKAGDLSINAAYNKVIAEKAAEGKKIDELTIKQLREEIADYKAKLDAVQKAIDDAKDNDEIVTRSKALENIKADDKKIPIQQNTGNNERYTPKEYIDAAREVLGTIDLDPASSELANETVKATKIYTAEDDGLNRYEIAQKHSLPFKTVTKDFTERSDAKIWILKNQLGRRNLIPPVRIKLALLVEEEIAATNTLTKSIFLKHIILLDYMCLR